MVGRLEAEGYPLSYYPSLSSASCQLLPRAKHRMSLFLNKPSSLLLLSLLLNLLCFLNLCNLYLSPTGITTTNLSNEPFSSALGPAEWELGPPSLIPTALLRAQTDPPWSSPLLTLPVSPMAYRLSRHSRKGPSKFTYPSYFFLLATLFFCHNSPTCCALRRTNAAFWFAHSTIRSRLIFWMAPVLRML